MGIGYETLSTLNPKLIHASISGYGASGPYAKRAGYDIIAGAEAGLLHITGEAGGPPSKPGVAVTDLCTGLFMHGAIMSALHARNRTGKGQKIDGSLFETQLALMINVAACWLNLGLEGKRWGTEHPSIVPYGSFPTKDSYLIMGATNNRQFVTLSKLLKRPELSEDKRFNTNDARVAHRTELNEIINDIFKSKKTKEWLSAFDESGLPYGPINSIESAFSHAQAQARQMVQTIDIDAATDGKFHVPGFPVKFSDTGPSIRSSPPLLGQHTEEVLHEIGILESEIAGLRRHAII